MFKYSALEVSKLSGSLNYNKNTTEKVLRLYSVLNFINESSISNMLVLKGGTAINLFLLDMPRLSVDIDFDFNLPLPREEMLAAREEVTNVIKQHMQSEGYVLSGKSKFTHSLDSYVYSYDTVSASRDILKIEINYSDRYHVLKPVHSESVRLMNESVSVLMLSLDELIGSKLNAMLVRTTPRDVYDMYNLFKNGLIKNEEMVRRIAVFYLSLGSDIPVNLYALKEKAVHTIEKMNYQKIKETLIPVLHKGIRFDVEEMTSCVISSLNAFFVPDTKDLKYIDEYNNRHFRPDILFEGMNTENMMNHPMGLWKTKM